MESNPQRGRGHPPSDDTAESNAMNTSPLQNSVYKDIGTIEMSDTQNVLGNNNSITYIFNGNRRNEDIPRNARREDLHDLATTARADHEIYCSQLLTKKRGYPLWVPGPGRRLPIEYRRQGISIGDVGITTSLGAFNFLFNIFQPADHPINRGGVPQGFSPHSLEELVFDIQEDTVYGPETYLATSSVRMTSMNRVNETSIVQRFESTAKEAAILIMPDGAITQDLYNIRKICDTISSNAENWYKYAKETRGRDVKNGDIRVVVGTDKVSSWGIATSACNTGQTASYVFKHDPIHTYKWDCSGGSGRTGPQKAEIRDLIENNVAPQNQCVFVRTVNFTLSGEMWKDFPSEVIEELEAGSDNFYHPDSASSNRGRLRYGGSGSGSTSSGQHQPSSTQGAWHRTPAVNFHPVELGANHPSAVLHKCLHEKFPDAKMVIAEDMDWISVLKDDAVVFPEPAELCERILKTHKLENCQGIIRLLRKDDSKLRTSNRMDLDIPRRPKIPYDIHKTPEQRTTYTASGNNFHPINTPQLVESENRVVYLAPFIRIDPFLVLPREMCFKILDDLDGTSLCRAAQVSKRWKALADDDVLWKRICERHIGRRCSKCGVYLPALKNVYRPRSASAPAKVQPVPFDSALTWDFRQDSSSIPISLTHLILGSDPCSDPFSPPLKRNTDSVSTRSVNTFSSSLPPAPPKTGSWKAVYGERMAVEHNWRRGRCKTRTLIGHTDGVMCLQFHETLSYPSFPVLISGSYDRTVRVWNMDTGEQLRCLKGHQLGVKALQFDEVKLITASMDCTLKVWDWRGGKCIKTLTGHTEGVVCLDYDSNVLASGSVDSTIRVWNLRTGGSFVLRGHSDWVNSVQLWDADPDRPEDASFFGPTSSTDCSFQIDPGKMLFSASDDGTIKLWDLNTRNCVRDFVGHLGQVQDLKLYDDECDTGDSDAPIASATTYSPILSGENDNDTATKCKRRMLVSASLDNTVKLWDIGTGQVTRTYFGHLEGVWVVAADKLRLVSGSHDRTIKIWSRDSEECLATLIEHEGAVSCLALAENKIVSGSDDKTIKIWSFSD